MLNVMLNQDEYQRWNIKMKYYFKKMNYRVRAYKACLELIVEEEEEDFDYKRRLITSFVFRSVLALPLNG